MDAIFKNEFIISKDLFMQYFKENNKRHQKILKIISIILILISILSCLIAIYIQEFGIYFFLHIIIIIMLLWNIIIRPKQMSITTYNKLISKKRSLQSISTFYDRYFEICKDKIIDKLEYENIKLMYETKDLLIIEINKIRILINKNKFIIGNYEEFKTFIKIKTNKSIQ